MELDFIGTSDNVVVSTVREVEVSVHQGPAGGTSTILVMEQDPTMNTMVLALQCATVLMCASSVPHCIVRCSYKCSLADACSRHIFATRNSSTNHNSGVAFPAMASAYMAPPAWPFLCLVTCLGPRWSSRPHKLNVMQHQELEAR